MAPIRNVDQLVKLLRERAIVASNVTIIFDATGGARMHVDGDAAAALAETPKALRDLIGAVRALRTQPSAPRLAKALKAAEALLQRMEGNNG